MSLPLPDDLKDMTWSFQAQPFIYVPTDSSITFTAMAWCFNAEPFVTNEAPYIDIPALPLGFIKGP